MKTYEQLQAELTRACRCSSQWLKKYYDAAGCYFVDCDGNFLSDRFGYPTESKPMSRTLETAGIEVYIWRFAPDGGKKVTRDAINKFRHMEAKMTEWNAKVAALSKAIRQGDYELPQGKVFLSIHAK